MRHARIRERSPYHSRPNQLLRLKRGRRTYVRLRIETQAEELERPPHRPYHGRIQVFLAKPVEAGIALHAFVAVHRSPFDRGIDINRPHRTDIGTVPAGHTFLWVYFHPWLLRPSRRRL